MLWGRLDRQATAQHNPTPPPPPAAGGASAPYRRASGCCWCKSARGRRPPLWRQGGGKSPASAHNKGGGGKGEGDPCGRRSQAKHPQPFFHPTTAPVPHATLAPIARRTSTHLRPCTPRAAAAQRPPSTAPPHCAPPGRRCPGPAHTACCAPAEGGVQAEATGRGGGGRAKTERDVSRVVRGRCTRPAAPCSVCGEQLAPRTLPLASQIPLPPPILHPSTPVSGRRRRCEARPPGSPPTRASQTRAGAPPGTAHRRTRRPHPGCLVLQQQRRRRRLHQTRAPSIALCLCRFHRTAQMAAPLAHSPMSGASTRSATSTRCSCVSSAGRKREAAAPASVRHRRSSCGQRRVGESEGGDARYAADWHATRPGQLPGQRKGRGGAGLTVGG